MRVTARVNIELAKATNYLILGNWLETMSYKLSDAGTPVVRVPDGTSLGYSVYALNVEASTIGASPAGSGASQWRLVESSEFIYMQAAYIERLQAAIVTAEKIEALMIKTSNLEVITGAKIAGFKVSGSGLTNGPEFNNDAYIIFRNDEEKTFAGIGGNVLPSSSGLRAIARFENRNVDGFFGSTNYGMLVEASGANRNIGIECIGDMILKGSLQTIDSVKIDSGYTNSITDNIGKYRVFAFTPGSGQYNTVYVPTYSQITSVLGSNMPSPWSITIEVTVVYNYAGAITLRGQAGAIITDNNGDVINRNDSYSYGGIRMEKGDYAVLRYLSSTSRWHLVDLKY